MVSLLAAKWALFSMILQELYLASENRVTLLHHFIIRLDLLHFQKVTLNFNGKMGLLRFSQFKNNRYRYKQKFKAELKLRKLIE